MMSTISDIKFKCFINKLANFYFFVQNLSEWHFSNRKSHNVFWRKEIGPFSEKEELAIKQFKEIHLRYPLGKSYLGRYFFIEKDPWSSLEKHLPKKDFFAVKNIFSQLQDKFHLLWKKDRLLLLKWQKLLDKKLNDSLLKKPIIKTLEILFNTKPSVSFIKVNLLISSPKHIGGGVNIDKENIFIDISRFPLEKVNIAMGVVWHETIHLCFQDQYFLSLLIKYFNGNQQKINLVNEATISSIFPRGILGIKLLKNEPAHRLLSQISQKQTIQIIKLLEEYIESKKSLDMNYLAKVAKILSASSFLY